MPMPPKLPNMPKRPKLGKSFRRSRGTGKLIKAKLSIDQSSVAELLSKLNRLMEWAASKEVVRKALLAGGEVLRDEMAARAPGPHIVVQEKPPKSLWAGGASREIKSTIDADGMYIGIGPDKEHWYYLFGETGVKEHGVGKRKSTRYQRFMAKMYGKATGAKYKDAMRKSSRNMRPAMAWSQGGQKKYVKRVRGFPAKPFMEESTNAAESDVFAAIAAVLAEEIEKAAK